MFMLKSVMQGLLDHAHALLQWCNTWLLKVNVPHLDVEACYAVKD